MAIIYQNPNGKIRGRLGPLYAKIVKGRNIFCIMPPKIGKMKEEMIDSLPRLKKFRVSTKFATNICGIGLLRDLNEQLRGYYYSAYTLLVSKNYSTVSEVAPTTNSIIVPRGFNIEVSSVIFTESGITGSIPALNSYTEIPETAKNVTIAGALVYTNPILEGGEKFITTRILKEVTNYQFTTIYNMNIPLDLYQQKLATLYNGKILYLTIIIQDADNKILKNTISLSFIE